MTRFGYKASAEQFAPRELLDFSVLAEDVGFDSVFVSDHLQPWRHDGGHAPAALPWLGALGASTDRIIMGTSVLTPTLRYHPAVIAQAFATLGCLFPGRVTLGVGSGESMNEAPLGIEWPDGKERFARLKEAVALIRELWSQERVDFEGTYYRTDKATIYDRPEIPVPIYIAGSGPAATRLAGRVGDGFITTSGKSPALYTDTLLPAVREGATKAGRQVDDLDLLIEVKVSFDPDHEKALNDCRFWGALALTPRRRREWRTRRRCSDWPMPSRRSARPVGSSCPPIPTSTSPRSSATSTSASPTWSSTPPAPTRTASSRSTGRRSSPASAEPSPARPVLISPGLPDFA